MRGAIYEWPRDTTRTHCACAVPLALWGTGPERGGSHGPTKKKKRMSLRRPLGPGFLVPYLIVFHGFFTRPLLILLPLLPTCARQGTGSLTRSRPPRETNIGSASAPPLPATSAPTANQRAGRSPSTPPRGAGLERGLAALATRLANQLAGHREELKGAWPPTNQNKASAPRAPCPPLGGVAVETRGSNGYRKAGGESKKLSDRGGIIRLAGGAAVNSQA
uniref:uncharacterized protein LOC132677746 n=1 Tax=Panthera onca TaxID=9690 RepID=UPI00295373B9|nr:uncharacterized protein LOC132677746 [Panthera onca]